MGGREWWHLSVGTRKRDRRGRESVRAASPPGRRGASCRARPTRPARPGPAPSSPAHWRTAPAPAQRAGSREGSGLPPPVPGRARGPPASWQESEKRPTSRLEKSRHWNKLRAQVKRPTAARRLAAISLAASVAGSTGPFSWDGDIPGCRRPAGPDSRPGPGRGSQALPAPCQG